MTNSYSKKAIARHPRLITTIHVAGRVFDGSGPSILCKPTACFRGEADTTATPNCQRDYTNTTG